MQLFIQDLQVQNVLDLYYYNKKHIICKQPSLSELNPYKIQLELTQ